MTIFSIVLAALPPKQRQQIYFINFQSVLRQCRKTD